MFKTPNRDSTYKNTYHNSNRSSRSNQGSWAKKRKRRVGRVSLLRSAPSARSAASPSRCSSILSIVIAFLWLPVSSLRGGKAVRGGRRHVRSEKEHARESGGQNRGDPWESRHWPRPSARAHCRRGSVNFDCGVDVGCDLSRSLEPRRPFKRRPTNDRQRRRDIARASFRWATFQLSQQKTLPKLPKRHSLVFHW